MALISNKFFQCKFYKRLPNQNTQVVDEPIHFKAELISDKDKQLSSRIQNLLTPNVRIILRTDSKLLFDSYEGEIVKGYVEFQNDLYQVQSVSYELVGHAGLAAGKFSKKHTEKNAIKVLVLV
jgi:hypothetical protein